MQSSRCFDPALYPKRKPKQEARVCISWKQARQARQVRVSQKCRSAGLSEVENPKGENELIACSSPRAMLLNVALQRRQEGGVRLARPWARNCPCCQVLRMRMPESKMKGVAIRTCNIMQSLMQETIADMCRTQDRASLIADQLRHLS